jgi:lipopolysaccharide/colanic/teichoic acid biosynthesis glycosyltransferase
MSVATDKIKPTKEMENKMAKAKSGLNAVQAIRYRELMWIAQFGEFMSATEFDELTKLMRLKGFK